MLMWIVTHGRKSIIIGLFIFNIHHTLWIKVYT